MSEISFYRFPHNCSCAASAEFLHLWTRQFTAPLTQYIWVHFFPPVTVMIQQRRRDIHSLNSPKKSDVGRLEIRMFIADGIWTTYPDSGFHDVANVDRGIEARIKSYTTSSPLDPSACMQLITVGSTIFWWKAHLLFWDAAYARRDACGDVSWRRTRVRNFSPQPDTHVRRPTAAPARNISRWPDDHDRSGLMYLGFWRW